MTLPCHSFPSIELPELDREAAALGIGDDDDVAVLELGAADAPALHVVQEGAVGRALVDGEELALLPLQPDVLAGGAAVVDDDVRDAGLAADEDALRREGEALPDELAARAGEAADAALGEHRLRHRLRRAAGD